MSWGAIVAIYFLFWVSAAFLMLPFGVRTDEEVGAAKVAAKPTARRTASTSSAT